MNEDYDKFVDKFKPKLTTDDCYTPVEVYNVVLDFVKNNCNIDGLEIIRPFYPGGDFENFNYSDNSVVIDNPPFSIISKIIRYYNQRNIRYFLFAPELTLFNCVQEYTAIVASANVIYENGANVKTSFVSNLFGEKKIIGSPELYYSLKKINDDKKAKRPGYEYPHNLVTVSQIAKVVSKGIYIEIDKKDVVLCSRLDHQKSFKKTIYGGGFLISNTAAKIKAAAEKLAAEKKNKKLKVWQLSEREKEIIESIS